MLIMLSKRFSVNFCASEQKIMFLGERQGLQGFENGSALFFVEYVNLVYGFNDLWSQKIL